MPGDADLAAFRTDISAVLTRFKKLTAVHVNQADDRAGVRALVQSWFRAVRPGLVQAGLEEELLLAVDSAMQALMRLAQGRSRRTNYVEQLNAAKRGLGELEVELEVAISGSPPPQAPVHSSLERAIVETLDLLVPSAALSYRQALLDLNDTNRVSFRGPANELRGVLWDVLERLAPDKEVMAASGYKHEAGLTKPTMKQKARYILKSRSLPEKARKGPEATVDFVEGIVATLTRAHYDRSSISAHLSSARSEVLQIKNYLDPLLAELLQVHVTRPSG